MRRFFVLLVILVAAIASAQQRRGGKPKPPPPPQRDPAPLFEVTSLGGTRYALEDLRGRSVVLHFWFADCAPCLRHFPALDALVRSPDGEAGDTVFLSFALDSADVVRPVMAQSRFSWSVVPEAAQVAHRLGVNDFPALVVIDDEGRLAGRIGAVPDLAERLATMLRALRKGDSVPAGPAPVGMRPTEIPMKPSDEEFLAGVAKQSPGAAARLRGWLRANGLRGLRSGGMSVVGRVLSPDGSGASGPFASDAMFAGDGWFAAWVEDPHEPIRLRSWAYEPLEIDLSEHVSKLGSQHVVDIGRFTLKRLVPARAATVRGRLPFPPGEQPRSYVAVLVVPPRPRSAAWGYMPHDHPQLDRVISTREDGSFELVMLPPGAVTLSLHMTGRIMRRLERTLAPGETVDLGEVELEVPRPVAITYVVSDSPSFTAPSDTARVRAGQSFRAEHPKLPPHASTFQIAQSDGRVSLQIFNGTRTIYRLGSGPLDRYRDARERVLPQAITQRDVEADGSVYLLHAAAFGHWVLFSARALDDAPVSAEVATGKSAVRGLGADMPLPEGCERPRLTATGGAVQCPRASLWWEHSRVESVRAYDEERRRYLEDGATESERPCVALGAPARCAVFVPAEGTVGPRGVLVHARESVTLSCRVWEGDEWLPPPCDGTIRFVE